MALANVAVTCQRETTIRRHTACLPDFPLDPLLGTVRGQGASLASERCVTSTQR